MPGRGKDVRLLDGARIRCRVKLGDDGDVGHGLDRQQLRHGADMVPVRLGVGVAVAQSAFLVRIVFREGGECIFEQGRQGFRVGGIGHASQVAAICCAVMINRIG